MWCSPGCILQRLFVFCILSLSCLYTCCHPHAACIAAHAACWCSSGVDIPYHPQHTSQWPLSRCYWVDCEVMSIRAAVAACCGWCCIYREIYLGHIVQCTISVCLRISRTFSWYIFTVQLLMMLHMLTALLRSTHSTSVIHM